MAESEVSAAVSAGKQGKTLLLKRRYRLLASGLFLWWLFALISGDVFPFADYGPTCAIVVRVCILVGCIAALAVFAKWRDGLKPWVMRVTAIAATVASFILGTGQMMVMLPFVLYLAGVVAGGCAACFLLGWASLYAKYHLENITVIALESVVIGAFLLWLETLIPDAGFRGLPMVLVPLVHLGFFYSINPSEISSKKMAETLPRFNKVCLYTPPVHGFSYGILAGIGLAGSTHVILPFIGTQALVVALAFVVFAALATIVLHQLQFNILHRPVIVLLIPMIIMAMFVLADDRWYPDYWILCAIVLYLTFLWIATCDIADILDLDIIWFFAIRFASALAALGVGFVIGTSVVAAFSATSPVVLGVVIAVLAFQVVSSITTMEDQQAMEETAEHAVVVSEAEISSGDICASLGEKFALSAREVEVLELLAQGRDPSRIQEQLFLSYHTVRNHIKSIYKKLDVHSRQELIDVLEKEMDLLKQAKPAKKKSSGSGSGRSKAAKAEKD